MPIERRPDYNLQIKTLEGVMTVNTNDFVIKGPFGEFYPCKPDILQRLMKKLINYFDSNFILTGSTFN